MTKQVAQSLAIDTQEALRLLDELERISFYKASSHTRGIELCNRLRALLSAKEGEPSGWNPMSTRPKDGQRIVYWFEPFQSPAVGTYHVASSVTDDLDYVSGKSGFTTVDPECPWWMPAPELRDAEKEKK